MFDFKLPKIDLWCLLAMRNKSRKNPNDVCRVKCSIHKIKADAYLKIKNERLKMAKESIEVLVLEFDYAHNLAFPKLIVTSQFFKRLFYDSSFFLYMYTIMDHCSCTPSLNCNAKRGLALLSLLYLIVLTTNIEDIPTMKKIILSKTAGEQNKNQTLLRFCSWL